MEPCGVSDTINLRLPPDLGLPVVVAGGAVVTDVAGLVVEGGAVVVDVTTGLVVGEDVVVFLAQPITVRETTSKTINSNNIIFFIGDSLLNFIEITNKKEYLSLSITSSHLILQDKHVIALIFY